VTNDRAIATALLAEGGEGTPRLPADHASRHEAVAKM